MTDYPVPHADAQLFATLRELWEEVDPIPEELADRIVAAVAIDDLNREWELLSLTTDAGIGAVRGPEASRTLQFGDGDTSVLLHVSDTEDGRRRIDGWVDAEVLAVRIEGGGQEHTAGPSLTGRFAFGSVPTGTARVRLVVKDGDGVREFMTPDFDI